MNKFEIGQLVATAGVHGKMRDSIPFKNFVERSFERYIQCDWGNMCDEDKELNDEAVKDGDYRIHGAYIDESTSEKIWIITDADRKCTTILFPHEY